MSLTGLEPGDYVEVEHLRAVRGLGGAYVADPFYFQVAGVPLFRSSYVVTAPEGLGLGVDAHGMPAPEVKREAGREVVRSLRTEVPAFVPEPGAVPMQEYLPFVQVGAGAERTAIQRGLGDAALERTKPTEELRALAAEVRPRRARAPRRRRSRAPRTRASRGRSSARAARSATTRARCSRADEGAGSSS